MPEQPLPHVLIVEDDPANLDALRHVLEDGRYRVVSASSGEEALRHLLQQDFAVVLLDVNLPGISGFETAELVRKRRRSEQTPIIFLTGRHPDAQHVFRGYEVGAVDYMVKPIVPEVLKSKVVVFVELYNKGAQIEAQKEELRAAAQRSEQRFYELVQGLDAVVWEGLPSQDLSFVSQRAEEVLGYPLEKWDKPGLRAEIMHADDRRDAMLAYRRAMRAQEGVAIEYRVRRADGQLAWMRDHVHVVHDAQGRALHLRGVMVDVTAHKQAEQRLQAQAAQLREADRHRNEFLAMLGHELRNPLAPIQSAVDWLRLQQNAISADIGGGIETIGRQVDHMSRLVDDLLDVSRITRGKIELRRSRLDLGEVARRAIETVRPYIDGKEHALQVELPETPVYIHGDPVRLTQVIANLLHNAGKYTPRGGHIALSVACEDGEAVIRVRDDGVGIEPAMLRRVFDLFTQAANAPDAAPGGLGVGLSLVRTLVEMHGGRVRAHSDGAGCGTEMTVSLTLVEGAGETPTQARAAPSAGPPRRILVVDDNEDAGRTFTMLLTAMGHRAEAVQNGAAALRALRRLRPEVVFLDIGMPDMDGYELARRIRARRGKPVPHLVALTGYGKASDTGVFDEFLLKPGERDAIEGILAGLGGEQLAGAG